MTDSPPAAAPSASPARVSGAFDAPLLPGELEQRRFARQRQQAITVLAALAITLAAFGINDYLYAAGDLRRFAVMLAVRALSLAAMGWVGVVVHRAPTRERFERILFDAMLVGVVVGIGMHLGRPRTELVVSRFELLCVVGYYVAVPMRTRRGVVPAMLMSVASVALAIFWHEGVSTPDLISITVCFALANMLGYLIGRQREAAEEEEALAWRALTMVNANLRKTLAELRELRSIVPVCPTCRKVRGSNDSWQRLEAYVSERDHISFSPILCPECLQREFGAVLPEGPPGG